MCGVAAFLSEDIIEDLEIPNLSLIKHRGPDKSACWTDENIWLGHTRLSILDLSEAGNQPMLSRCGNYVIIYNGEIYNHLELRKQFLKNDEFVGHSDTETILALYTRFKEEMLPMLVGMWSILIWDKSTKTLFISRDRFGQKPLYVRKTKGGWTLASEMKVLGLGIDTLTFNSTAIADYLSNGNYGHLGTETFFNEINQFPAGSFATLRSHDLEIKVSRFWTPPLNIKRKKFNEDTRIELKNLVVDAVMSQTLSDVPIGITLSGGIDSSVIAGILAKHYPNKIHVFTAQTPGHALDESKYVKAVIERFDPEKVEVHWVDLTKISLTETLSEYLKIQEEPFGDPSISAHGLLMKAAKDAGIKVILNGQGADEIFSGYDHALPSLLSHQIRSFHLKDFFSNYKALSWPKSSWIKLFLSHFLPAGERKIRINNKIKREEFINPSWIYERKESLLASPKNYNSILLESLFGIHLPHLLHYDDRNAMHYGVEGRTPFLDHRILEKLCEIDLVDFLKDGKRKYLLRESCGEYLPELVMQRKDKIGFFTPLKSMIINEQETIKSTFESALEGKMKRILLEDMEGIEKNKTDIISILRVYRVYSILLFKELIPVKFLNN